MGIYSCVFDYNILNIRPENVGYCICHKLKRRALNLLQNQKEMFMDETNISHFKALSNVQSQVCKFGHNVSALIIIDCITASNIGLKAALTRYLAIISQ